MEQRWRIQLLGRFRVCWGEYEVSHFPRQKASDLLAYLALSHSVDPRSARSVSREALIEQLWPEIDPDAGRKSLSKQLYALRQALAASGSSADLLLMADRERVGLRPAAFTTDVQEFTTALQTAARLPAGAEQAAHLAEAVGFYAGELLPDQFEAWVLGEREVLRLQYLQARQQLVASLEAAGDLLGALQQAREAVAADPLREEAHYDLMRLLAATGQPSACLRQYQELERLLREELDETPSVEARALAEELREQARTIVVARRAPPAGTPPSAPASPAPGAGEPERGSLSKGEAKPRGGVSAPRLPVQLTRFFGREAEITRLTELLSAGAYRLVTLSGPGGSGKTRLAIAVAGRLQEQFSEAVVFVPLTDLTDAARIPEAIAAALELDRSAGGEATEQVVQYLSAQPWLLVLDNFEHLVEGGALLVRQLLERVPTLTCLVTSRRRLGLGGEQEFALLPLPTPRASDFGFWISDFGLPAMSKTPDNRASLSAPIQNPKSKIQNPDSLLQYPSVQLFVDRARAARADFQLTEANATAVAELCDRLEGLPLALELAAARVNALAPTQLLALLEQRFQFLVSRHREVPRRHRSLREAIESSVQLLSPELQRFFARLSVFRGGWTLEAAAAVADFEFWILDFGLPAKASDDRTASSDAEPTTPEDQRPLPDPIQNTLECLEQLRDCSVIQVEEREEEVRYRVLETVREYGWEQLAASGELPAVRSRHRDWYLRLAEQAEAAVGGPHQKTWLRRLEAELDNLRAALAWCQADVDAGGSRGSAEAGLRLVGALRPFWESRGYLTEGIQWAEVALAQGSGLPPALRAPALLCAGYLTKSRGDRDRAGALLQAARCEYEKALALARAAGDRPAVAQTLQYLADIAYHVNDPEGTCRYSAEARQLFEELGDKAGLARSLETIAVVLLQRGDPQASRRLREESLTLRRELGDSFGLVHALGGMGHLARDEGDYARARACYCESLMLRRESGLLLWIAMSLEDLASLAGREGRPERAIRLLGAAEAFCETLGATPPVAYIPEYERTVAEARAALDEASFAAAWAEGRAMSMEKAVAYALQADSAP